MGKHITIDDERIRKIKEASAHLPKVQQPDLRRFVQEAIDRYVPIFEKESGKPQPKPKAAKPAAVARTA